MEGELRCLEKNKRYPGAKAGAHCKLAPSSKRHRGRSFADQSELNTIASIYHLVGFERILSGIAIRYICWDSYINVSGHQERTAQIMSLALTTIAELNDMEPRDGPRLDQSTVGGFHRSGTTK